MFCLKSIAVSHYPDAEEEGKLTDYHESASYLGFMESKRLV
jgi:hypothetical protein